MNQETIQAWSQKIRLWVSKNRTRITIQSTSHSSWRLLERIITLPSKQIKWMILLNWWRRKRGLSRLPISILIKASHSTGLSLIISQILRQDMIQNRGMTLELGLVLRGNRQHLIIELVLRGSHQGLCQGQEVQIVSLLPCLNKKLQWTETLLPRTEIQ